MYICSLAATLTSTRYLDPTRSRMVGRYAKAAERKKTILQQMRLTCESKLQEKGIAETGQTQV